jgi:lysophospholipase L1-like esterase
MKQAWLLVALAACGRATADQVPHAAAASAAGSTASSTATATTTATTTGTETTTGTATGTANDGGDDSRKGTLVVHIGDSFTEAFFEQNLRPRFGAVGAKYWVKAKTPSYSTEWAFNGVLDQLLWSKPQLVLITLGANEIEMPDPSVHAAAVRALAKKASQTGSCVWITPPLWKKDTGFLEVIRQNCAPCIYFDSDAYVSNVERKPDKIHPNEVGGARWAAAFWDWLEAHRDPSRGPWALSP